MYENDQYHEWDDIPDWDPKRAWRAYVAFAICFIAIIITLLIANK